MLIKSTNGATGWRLILEIAFGAIVPCLILMAVLFESSIGEYMPNWMRIGAPILIWATGVIFFIAHRTPDKKNVEFKVW